MKQPYIFIVTLLLSIAYPPLLCGPRASSPHLAGKSAQNQEPYREYATKTLSTLESILTQLQKDIATNATTFTIHDEQGDHQWNVTEVRSYLTQRWQQQKADADKLSLETSNSYYATSQRVDALVKTTLDTLDKRAKELAK